MPGSIHLIVLDAFDLPEAAGDGVSIKASMGKKQFVTEVLQPAAGRAGPWEDEHAFSVMSLTDHLVISLLDAKGESLGSAQVTTPSIVEKGFRDEALLMKDGKGGSVGRVHVKLSFVLSDEERKKIETMRAKSLAKKGGADSAASPQETPSTGLNGRRASGSRSSMEKETTNGDESPGVRETAAVVAAVGAEVDAHVAHASSAAMQAAADVAQAAKEAAASPTSDATVTPKVERMARKGADTAEKAGGVAATAANGVRAKGRAVEALKEAGAGGETLERRPSVKDRVKAFEAPERTSSSSSSKGTTPARSSSLTKSGDGTGSAETLGAEDTGSEDDVAAAEARAAEDDWERAQAVEAALRRVEERQRAEDAARVGREAEEARRYEQEYREQRARREEYLRHEEERKRQEEEHRAAKAAAAARKEAAAREHEEESVHAAGTERDDDDSEEGGMRNVWQQVAGTVAFAVALFMLWPRDSKKRVTSKRRGNVSGGKYVVQKGDTLNTIVGRMCYNPDSDFYKLNPGVCDRNTIYPGQVLQVPEYV